MPLLAALALAGAVAGAAAPGSIQENVVTRRDAKQTYTLFLPSSAADGKRHPLLVVLDPRGRATLAAEIFRPAAEELGWIVVSSNQSRSDASGDPNTPAVTALLPDALERYPVDAKRVYLAGFSGTAMYAWAFATNNDFIAGVIGVGGRLIPQAPPERFPFAHYGFTGDLDFNNREMRSIEAILERRAKAPHRLDVFDGDHRWIDAPRAREALLWMDVVAMKEGRRAHDEALISAAMAADLTAARALESSSRRLEALRRFQAIARTYEGLADVEAVRKEVSRLESDRETARERKAEAKWDEYELRYQRDVLFGSVTAAWTASQKDRVPVSAAILSRQLRLGELKERAERPGAEGRAGRRLLEAVFSDTSFYLTRQLFEKKEYGLAVAVLGVAAEIHPDRWPVQYNLGAAHARLGNAQEAIAALRRAVDLGFASATLLEQDEDYASVRALPEFGAIAARLPR